MNRDDLILACFSRPHTWELEHTLEAVSDVDVIAHCETGVRTILINGHPTIVGQIAWVCTDPDYRGDGLMSALIRAANRWAGQRGAIFSGLFSDIPRFYNQLGYHDAGNLGKWGMIKPLGDDQWPHNATIDLQGDMW